MTVKRVHKIDITKFAEPSELKDKLVDDVWHHFNKRYTVEQLNNFKPVFLNKLLNDDKNKSQEMLDGWLKIIEDESGWEIKHVEV